MAKYYQTNLTSSFKCVLTTYSTDFNVSETLYVSSIKRKSLQLLVATAHKLFKCSGHV